MAVADLHLHSTASDGQLAPREVVQMAWSKQIQVIALTDHDTTEGVEEALAAGREFSLQVIPGIELSAEQNGEEVHILGYYINYASASLHEVLMKLRQARVTRNQEIVRRLQRLGFSITWDDVAKIAADASSMGRPHVARAMMEKGYAQSISEVFSKWIGPGKPAFVQRYKLSPAEAIEIIHSVGGLAFLAHPGLLNKGLETARKLILYGLDGIEVYHIEHSEGQSKDFLNLARAEGLFVSGGSDCHGRPGDIRMGQAAVDIALIQPWLKA